MDVERDIGLSPMGVRKRLRELHAELDQMERKDANWEVTEAAKMEAEKRARQDKRLGIGMQISLLIHRNRTSYDAQKSWGDWEEDTEEEEKEEEEEEEMKEEEEKEEEEKEEEEKEEDKPREEEKEEEEKDEEEKESEKAAAEDTDHDSRSL